MAGAADRRTFAWRDYGNRVGVWRCLELFDELRPCRRHLINTTVFDYAQIVGCAEGIAATSSSATAAPMPEHHGQMWEADALPRGSARRHRQGSVRQATARLDGAVDGSSHNARIS